jgi:hypothetical protein
LKVNRLSKTEQGKEGRKPLLAFIVYLATKALYFIGDLPFHLPWEPLGAGLKCSHFAGKQTEVKRD